MRCPPSDDLDGVEVCDTEGEQSLAGGIELGLGRRGSARAGPRRTRPPWPVTGAARPRATTNARPPTAPLSRSAHSSPLARMSWPSPQNQRRDRIDRLPTPLRTAANTTQMTLATRTEEMRMLRKSPGTPPAASAYNSDMGIAPMGSPPAMTGAATKKRVRPKPYPRAAPWGRSRPGGRAWPASPRAWSTAPSATPRRSWTRAHRDEERLLAVIDAAHDVADLVARTSGGHTPD